MARLGRGYLNMGLGWIINLVLAIIPVTSWLLGGITRILRGHLIAGILQLVFPVVSFIFWILDIITVAGRGDLIYWAL